MKSTTLTISLLIISLLCSVTTTTAQQVTASLSTNYCTLGNSVKLSISVTENKNNSLCTPPALNTIRDFIKSFRTLQNRPDTKHTSKDITYSWLIKPTTTGIIEVPPLPFIFQSKTEKQVIYTRPIPLQVTGTKNHLISPINLSQNTYNIKPLPGIFRQPVATPLQQYLWEKVNSEVLTAITKQDFSKATTTYIELIKTGFRSGEIYYNLGTAFLHANQPNEAWQAFTRAERYVGHKSNIVHNMKYAATILSGNNLDSWQRKLFKWHFQRSISTRLSLTTGCLIVIILFILIIITNHSNATKHQKRLLIFTVILFTSFSTSVAISIINELADRNREKQYTPPYNLPISNITADETCKSLKQATPGSKDISQRNDIKYPHQSINTSITATITSDINAPYINQIITITLTIISISPLSEEIDINNMPPSNILYREPFKELPVEYIKSDGKMQETHQYTCKARVLTQGNLTVAPMLNITMVKDKREISTTIPTSPLQLNAKALPKNNTGKKYSGAIGKFTIQSKTTPVNANTTDLIKTTTTIDGTGYIPEDYLPQISHAPDFIVYAPKKTKSTKHRLVAEQFIAPLSSKKNHIPEIEFTYFNPETGKYKTATIIHLSMAKTGSRLDK